MKTLAVEVKAKIGDWIKVLPLDLKTTVNGIYLMPNGKVKYFVEYFHNGVRQDAYVYADEFETL